MKVPSLTLHPPNDLWYVLPYGHQSHNAMLIHRETVWRLTNFLTLGEKKGNGLRFSQKFQTALSLTGKKGEKWKNPTGVLELCYLQSICQDKVVSPRRLLSKGGALSASWVLFLSYFPHLQCTRVHTSCSIFLSTHLLYPLYSHSEKQNSLSDKLSTGSYSYLGQPSWRVFMSAHHVQIRQRAQRKKGHALI